MTTTPIAAARVSGTIDRIARELCVSENEIWDEATQGYRDRWHEEAARILAAIQPDPEPQPVAWQRRVKGRDLWQYIAPEEVYDQKLIGNEVRPLYATPSSAGTVSVEVGRLPTQAEAVAAAKVLLRCNGADLDEWTNGEWFDAEAALRALAGENKK